MKRPALRFGLFLAAVLVFFFWPMLVGREGYYHGDYKQQFYPWAYYLSERIRHFSLPLWAPEIGCGFPLLAEGQAGALYPLHWILFLILPFPASYHVSFIALFAMAGAFSYLFFRECGLSLSGACLACLVFLFGSAYGGFFYGVMALRTLVWFPLSLFFIEKLCKTGGGGAWAAGLGAAWAMSFLGGYPQMACYAVLVGAGYFFLQAASKKEKGRLLAGFLLAVLLGAGLSAAQTLPTLELVRFSSRADAGLDFALDKSFSPLNLATLLLPSFGAFLRFDFYVGILPLLLVCLAFRGLKDDWRARSYAIVAVFFVFLGLGRFNPFYVFFLKTAHFYFFRVPSKFLFFSSFFLAGLAGVGFDRLASGGQKEIRFFLRAATDIFLATVAAFASAGILARAFRPAFMEWGRRFVETRLAGKPGHPHSVENYLSRLSGFMELVLERTRVTDPYFLRTLAVWAVLIFLIGVLGNRFFQKKVLVAAVLGITLFDLYQYTALGTGFKGNRVSSEAVGGDEITAYLSTQKGLFRTYEFAPDASSAPRWPANANMLFGYSSVGLYSPLAIQAYREYLRPLGAVDDATGLYPTTKQSLIQDLERLDLMNVKYVLSKESLDEVAGLHRLFQSKTGEILYENGRVLPRAFLVGDLNLNGQKISGDIQWLEYKPEALHLRLDAPQDAFLFLSESYYPGWRAEVDGKKTPMSRAEDVFRAVRVPKGTHEVKFFYEPLSFRIGWMLSAFSLFGLGFFVWSEAVRTKKVAS